VVRDGAGRPARVVEQKDASPEERALDEVNAGLYCVEAGFLWEALSQVGSSNAQREFYLTDLVAMAARAGGAEAVPVSDVEAAGVNDREDLARAGRLLTRRAASALMRAGVTIEDPDRFDVDEGVEVGEETVIEPNVRLLGRTRVGPGCRLGAGSVLRDTVVGEGVTVNPYTVTDDARLERGAIVGPFSRLRPGADIGEEAHVGNFVEVKKTRLGKGSKANHLAYLGDARIGERVNVGAGTITCNYDGERKNPTVIGDGAFIGSDSILVAPIEIGAGAYVAAGSTLTDAVPPGALALGRARQSNKEGWAEKRQAAKGEKK
jgi:bifunctional UDP-N-acetylglucosamine pyrophosphorylase/glucosamine-1-phosphate N-acetyltransferase